jgi:hypothetical protein
MNLRKPLIIAATAAALLTGTALPASAADTVTTFTLTGGSLTLAVQPTAALTDGATSVGTSTIAGSLGASSVTDDRGGIGGWVVSGASTGFTGPSTASVSVMYSTLAVVETGTNTVAAADADTVIGSATPLLTATAVSGNNTASWTPGLKVNLPAGALAGAYSGTVTTSIV